MEVPADSLEEAKGRVKVMSMARYDGELVARIPAGPGASMLVRWLVGLGNRGQR